jgi:hypothetical protein
VRVIAPNCPSHLVEGKRVGRMIFDVIRVHEACFPSRSFASSAVKRLFLPAVEENVFNLPASEKRSAQPVR